MDNQYEKSNMPNPGRPLGNPVGGTVGVGEVLAGEYRPEQAKERMRLHDGGDSPTPNTNQTLQGGRGVSGSARVAADAHRELANQCSQMTLVDHATRVVKEAVHQGHRVGQAAEYLDLAAKYPDIARMIELARNGLY